MKPIRVGLVIGQLHRGGTEKQLVLLARGLAAESGIDPVVYCLSELVEPHGPKLRDAGVPVRCINAAATWPRRWCCCDER